MLFGRYPFDPTPAPTAAAEGAAAGNAPLIGSDGRSAVFTQGLREKANSGARRLIERIIGMQVGPPAPPIHTISPTPPFKPSDPHRPLPTLPAHTAHSTPSHLAHHSNCTALIAPHNLEDLWTEPTNIVLPPRVVLPCTSRTLPPHVVHTAAHAVRHPGEPP